MKFLLLAIFCISRFSTCSQNLQQYSYYMHGIKKNKKATQSTFFLTKYGKQIYLITAAHIITGGHAPENHPDTFFLRFLKKNGEYGQIVWATAKYKNRSPSLFYKEPDLFVSAINLPEELIVNSIEDFIMEDYSNIKPVSATAYGFSLTPKNKLDIIQNKTSIKGTGTVNGNIHRPVFLKDLHIYDSINYVLNIDSSMGPGFSGSPVFLRDKDGTVMFGGVCIKGDLRDKKAFIVRPEFVKSALINATINGTLPLIDVSE